MFHITNGLILEICRQKLKKKMIKHCKYYCKSTKIKIVFSPFKGGNLFSVKESVPKYLRFFVVYRFPLNNEDQRALKN